MGAEPIVTPLWVDGDAVERVIEPVSVDELRDALAAEDARGTRLLIAGGRTRLAYGNVGGPFDALLSTRRLNRVLHYEPDDMTLAVEPGVTIAEIHAVLSAGNQAMALDVAHADRATIGGSFATGLSSPRRLGGGALKDWVIGIEVVAPNGTLAKAGGMVVKNVTGFDMMHVHYGALGAFGVVTRLNLKVFPRMTASRAVTLHFGSAVSAHAAGVGLLRSQLQPASLTVSNQDGWRLDVRCDAPISAIGRLAERIVAVAEQTAAPARVEVSDDGDAALQPFIAALDLTGEGIVARLPVAASEQPAVLERVAAMGGVEVCADIGSGLVYLRIATGDGVAIARALHPQATILAAPADGKRGHDVFGTVEPPAAKIVRQLKREFDPGGRLNGGRFVMGL